MDARPEWTAAAASWNRSRTGGDVLEAHGLEVAAPGGPVVVSGLDLALQPGEWVALGGPNGSGKSSLLATLAGLHAPLAGRVTLGGEPITPESPARSRVAFVFQEAESYFLTPEPATEIAFPLENLGWPRAAIENRVRDVAARLGINSLLHRPLDHLSGGEAVRVALAAALAAKPEWLLLDEPGNYLDPGARASLREVIRQEVSRGTGVIWVSQLPEEHAAADRSLTLDGGRLGESPRTPVRDRERLAPRPPVPAGIPLLTADEVTVHYPERGRVLERVSLELTPGERVLVEGPSGSGKTSLLHVLAGLSDPHQGRVTAASVAGSFGILLQSPEDQLTGATVLDDLRSGSRQPNRDERALRALAEAGLAPERFGQLPPESLSHGERRRVAWAGLAMLDARVWLLDEPSAGVDEVGLAVLERLVRDHQGGGGAVLIAHQDPRLALWPGRHLRLSEGRLMTLN